MDALINYVSYGSNLHLARFRCYLAGGQPPGSARVYTGCRDHSAPLAVRPTVLAHRLYFAGESAVWGGGVAFVEVEHSNAATLGFAYLITVEQFADVVAQENRRPVPGEVDPGGLAPGENRVIDDLGWYDTLVGLDPIDGVPAVTFTTSRHHTPNAPAPAYLNTIAAGICAHHPIDEIEALRYLAHHAGASLEK